MKIKNVGSAVIEITLLIPVFLGCIFFYIMLFLFFVDSGKKLDYMAGIMYALVSTADDIQNNREENVVVREEGKVKIFWIEQHGGLFDSRLELRKNENDAVENIRRWQLVTGMF